MTQEIILFIVAFGASLLWHIVAELLSYAIAVLKDDDEFFSLKYYIDCRRRSYARFVTPCMVVLNTLHFTRDYYTLAEYIGSLLSSLVYFFILPIVAKELFSKKR